MYEKFSEEVAKDKVEQMNLYNSNKTQFKSIPTHRRLVEGKGKGKDKDKDKDKDNKKLKEKFKEEFRATRIFSDLYVRVYLAIHKKMIKKYSVMRWNEVDYRTGSCEFHYKSGIKIHYFFNFFFFSTFICSKGIKCFIFSISHN